MIIGQDRSSSRLIDEAWAVCVGEEVDGDYPLATVRYTGVT